MEALQELDQFLAETTRLDVKNEALQNILGLTGTPEGCLLLKDSPAVLGRLLTLSEDWKGCESIAKDACLALVNLTADARLVPPLLELEATGRLLLRCVLEPSSPVADPACMAVCNMTREPGHAEQAWQQLQSEEGLMDRLMAALSATKYNQRDAALHYLAPLISNLSQLTQVRRMLLDPERCVMQRLVPFTQYTESSIRRGGVISTLRNCCFDVEHHEWLLGPSVDLLPALLLPLAGPDVFSEEETERLPPDLQYLEEDKQRETDPDLRRLILEAIARLCARRSTREMIREQGAAYLILRELHKWEEDRAVLLACENLVDLLIRTEEEIGVDDLRHVDVPENLTTTFTKEDETFLQLS